MKPSNNIQILYGEEDFLINKHIETYKGQLNKQTLDLNFMKYKEDDIEIPELIEKTIQVPFMDKFRITIYYCEDFFKLLSLLNEKEMKMFMDYIDNPLDSAFLIIVTKKIDKRLKNYNNIKNKIKIQNYSALDKIKFNKFLDIEFKNNDLIISKNLKNYYIEKTQYLEKDTNITLYDVFNQIKKLSSLKDKNISIDVIDNIIEESKEGNLFRFIDTIFSFNYESTIIKLKNLDEKILPVNLILSQIINRLGLLIKILTLKTKTNDEISEIISIHPYSVKKNREQVNYFDIKTLLKLYFDACNIEYLFKTSKINDKIALEIIISKIYRKIV